MIDDAKSIAPGSVLQADVCIVGGGAAGVTVALELIASGKSILILESGGRAEEAETQALYAGETADEEDWELPGNLARVRQALDGDRSGVVEGGTRARGSVSIRATPGRITTWRSSQTRAAMPPPRSSTTAPFSSSARLPTPTSSAACARA